MNTFTRALSLTAALAALLVASTATSEDVDYARAQLLCQWKDAHAPGNPRPLDFCAQPDLPANTVRNQMADWWGFWYEHDDNAAANLKNAFDQAWRDQLSREEYSASALPLSQLSVTQLCERFAKYGAPRERAELVRRKAFTANQWKLIDSHHFLIGSSETLLLCSWGAPDKINTMATANVFQQQYVYSTMYVYIENGRVTAFQTME